MQHVVLKMKILVPQNALMLCNANLLFLNSLMLWPKQEHFHHSKLCFTHEYLIK